MMTFYKKQVFLLSTKFYSNVYLTRQIIQAKNFIDSNFRDNINLGDISKDACISKFHLIRSFKKIYGKTPNQHLVSVRIEEAKKLLKANASILEVCHSIGFDSPTTFAALFRKMAGESPHAFQKRLNKKGNFEEVYFLLNTNICRNIKTFKNEDQANQCYS